MPGAACRDSPDSARPSESKVVEMGSPAATAPAMVKGGLGRESPPGANERIQERADMVESQLRRPTDGRERITDERVLQAMQVIPRHRFIPERMRRSAYHDGPLPIGHDQTISQPYIVAIMTEALGLSPDQRVLEIGTGSGYQAAVLAHLTREVYTIEIVAPLAETARRTLHELGYDEVHCRTGDGYKGWPEAAPFDAIIITCAAPQVPAPLWEQLKTGGHLIMPLGETSYVQQLILLTKKADGSRDQRKIIPVTFVPMTREREAR